MEDKQSPSTTTPLQNNDPTADEDSTPLSTDVLAASISTQCSLTSDELESAYNIVISIAKSKGYNEAIDEAFNNLDSSNTGMLNRCDIQAFLSAAAAHTKLDAHDVDESIIEAAVDALIWDAGGNEQGLITRLQFHLMFERHPDMMAVFEDDITSSQRRHSALSHMSGHTVEWDLEELDDEKETWIHYLLTHWKNRWVTLLWLLLYIAANVAVFTHKAMKYANNEEAQAVFGNCITVARGCASALNLNAFLVLLVMCRHFMTVLRKTPFRFCFPFDALHEMHIMIGILFGLFAASHTAAHVCDFHRLGHADETDIYALFGDNLPGLPESYSARWGYMLKTRAGITGIIMVVCLIVAYSFAFNRREHFNRFWYTHHLLLVMLICLCVHGSDNLLEPFQSLYWVIGPLVLYFTPRIWRETPSSSLDIIKMEVEKGDVIQLRLKKHKHYNGYVKSGMYGFLNIPQVSRFEWHPFTFTSGESDDFIEFHFRRVGDWTGRVYDLMQSKADDRLPSGIQNPPIIKVEGPIGASSQGFSDYSTCVLIGAGIGITPMISVLKQLLLDPGKVRRCFFYWTVRDRDSFLWFSDLMDAIFEADKKNLLQIRHFLTSVKHDTRDLGAVLLHHATRAHYKRTNVDLILGHQIHHQVEVGRPIWSDELDSVREETLALNDVKSNKCGVFLCGPSKMADAVYKASVDISKSNPGFHIYFSKETF